MKTYLKILNDIVEVWVSYLNIFFLLRKIGIFTNAYCKTLQLILKSVIGLTGQSMSFLKIHNYIWNINTLNDEPS
jgi:hypothetical protein